MQCFVAGTPILVADGHESIEDIEVGDRVTSPGECPSDVDETWLRVTLQMAPSDAPEDLTEIVLFRSAADVATQGWMVGATINDFAIEELPVRGTTTVTAIEPAPPVQPGDGCVVTMTVNHNNTAVLSLTFVDGETPLLTTTYHPFFSVDRNDWVHADELVPGETVRSHDGVLVLEASEPVAGVHRVYNFEVEKTHTYYAGDDDAWVHNACVFPSAGELAKRFGVKEKEVHRVKEEILNDLGAVDSPWRKAMNKLGRNPDIGVTDAGNLAIKSRLDGSILETDVPIAAFGGEL